MFTGIIRLNDKLSSGGTVISASSTMIIDGVKAALVDDEVMCPLPGHGKNKIIQGSEEWISDGKLVAFDKCLCQCGCYVISSLPGTGIG
ncbi:PAAR domain-containing protein [Rahnella bonaserana]